MITTTVCLAVWAVMGLDAMAATEPTGAGDQPGGMPLAPAAAHELAVAHSHAKAAHVDAKGQVKVAAGAVKQTGKDLTAAVNTQRASNVAALKAIKVAQIAAITALKKNQKEEIAKIKGEWKSDLAKIDKVRRGTNEGKTAISILYQEYSKKISKADLDSQIKIANENHNYTDAYITKNYDQQIKAIELMTGTAPSVPAELAATDTAAIAAS
ncbi:MAG: hypothetical protein WCG04_01260 [Alphaproteobacteria bacterium]